MERLTRDSTALLLTTYQKGAFEDYLTYLIDKYKGQTFSPTGKFKVQPVVRHTELKDKAIDEWLAELKNALEEPYRTAASKPAFTQLKYARTYSTKRGARSVPNLFFILKAPLAGRRYKDMFDYTLRYLIPDSRWEDIIESLAHL